ncbi:MAG: hypothetical protein WD696_22935 [Bryobacteraceae bacterium]
MRSLWLVFSLAGYIFAGGIAAQTTPKARVARIEPKALSVHPFTGQRGATFVMAVRGNGLREATGVFLDDSPLKLTIEGTEAEPPSESTAKSKVPFDLVRLRVETAPDVAPGRYLFRLVTPHGVSNALPLHITEYPIASEPKGAHETPEAAVAVDKFPVVFNGGIFRRGESDYYAFHAAAGQMVTFEAISGLPSIGGPGGNARGFDPSLSVYEPSGSWFDPKRLNRIAFNDEPLWVSGRLTDAHLVHKFEKTGRYLLRVEAFSGQGGPDYSYHLKILPGIAPQDVEPAAGDWNERGFQRRLSADRLNELAARGGKPRNKKSVETYRAAAVPAAEAGAFKLPGTLEGSLGQPGEAHRARFQLDGPQDIAIEVETPATAPPLFNPVVRLLDTAGQEVATNVFVGVGDCSGEMSKSLQAKTIIPLRDAGGYTVEIRDTTSDLAEPGFRYRVQVRPQIPHVGQISIDVDHVNLVPGDAQMVRVIFDREEDYRGAIAVTAESLPPGVQASAGADFEPDKDPPRFPGKRERYTARTERTVVVFTADADAAPTAHPWIARLAVRPIVDGKPGEILETKQIPMMVVAKP